VSAGTVSGNLTQWHPVEIDFNGPFHRQSDQSPNPFLDYRLTVNLSSPSGRTFAVPGFFAGDGSGGAEGDIWRIRFSPDEPGNWLYQADFRTGAGVAVNTPTTGDTPARLEGERGEFSIAERDPDAPGFLKHGALEYVGEHYLKFRDGTYWIKSGTNSPENLLGYAGIPGTSDHGGLEADFLHEFAPHIDDASPALDPFFTNPDTGVDSRGLTGAINYLAGAGVNSVYFLPLNLGGDGQDTFPYLSAENTVDAKTHFDLGKLYQWFQIFEHTQRLGIFLHVALAETEIANARWLDNGELGVERQLFLRELISRYAFVLGLKWNISEENNFPLDFLRRTAAYIDLLDWTNKPVTVQPPADDLAEYESLLGDTGFAATSIQYRVESSGDIVELMRERSRLAGHPWVVDMDDNTTALGPDNASLLRKQALYDIYFSGGNVEWNVGFAPLPVGGDINLEDFRSREQMWQFTKIAREFMEQHLPFWEMNPVDDLVSGAGVAFGGAEVFAKEGEIYAIYLPQADSATEILLDLSAANGELFVKQWFNPETGEFEGSFESLTASASSSIGVPPSRNGDDWVVLLTRSESTTIADSTSDETVVESTLESEQTGALEGNLAEVSQIEQSPVATAQSAPVTGNSQSVVGNESSNSPPQISELASNFFVESGIPIEFTVSATDQDGKIPSIFLLNAPEGSEFNDNRDGTRTFLWVPLESDDGVHGITIVAVDALDSNLRAAHELVINVTVPPLVTSSQVTDVPTVALSATGQSNQPPQLNLPDGSAIPVGATIDLVFLPVDAEGVVPSLSIEQLPQGASFVDNGNGTRSIQWTPQPEDRGSYPLVVIVADGRDPNLTSMHEFLLEIVPAEPGNLTAPGLEVAELTRAPINQPPVFPELSDEVITVGQQLQLDVLPRDPEGIAPVLHVQNAPDTSSFADNGRGGRLFVWTPGTEDVGEHFLRFIAIDAADSSLSTEIVRKITVVEG